MAARRLQRVNDLIRDEISELLRREVRDPRLSGIISITHVDTSPDLRYAKVYVSIMGTDQDKQEAERGLQAASGFLRRGLGARLTIRYTPELLFCLDESIEKGDRLLQLIKEVSPAEDTGDGDES